MKRIICRIIERVFPHEVKRIKETNRARRDAIQKLLDADLTMRAQFKHRAVNGDETSIINNRLNDALRAYERGQYGAISSLIPTA